MLPRHMALTLTELERRVRSLKIRAEDARRARVVLMLADGTVYLGDRRGDPVLQHVLGQHRVKVPGREAFEQLAADLEAVWNAPHADIRIKKRLVRTLIHEIVVAVQPEAGEVILVIHWKGGVHPALGYPADGVDKIAATPRRRSSRRYACSHESARLIC